MSSPENPGESGKPGPLDELFPHLKQPKEELPRLPVHARVLEVPEPAGTVLVVVVWSDPGTSLSLHQEVRQRFEGTLLAELSRPASELLAEELRPRAFRVVVVGKARSDLDRALGAFGLVRTKPEGSSWNETLAYVRGEAPRVGEPVPEDFDSFWEVAIHTAPGERGENVARLEAALRPATGKEVWGEKPGAFFQRAAAAARELLGERITPDSAGLLALEHLIGQVGPGHVRWIPPVLFQTFCDAVGVVASREYGRDVQWAPSEPDELGFAPPPLLRAKIDEGFVHLPIGLHLLRWSVMPLAKGESPPTVADWVLDQFGARK